MPPRYSFPYAVIAAATISALRGTRRSFHADARAIVAPLEPPLCVAGREHVPAAGPALITINHYGGPPYFPGWVSAAVSAAVPAEIHWISTAAHLHEGRRRRHLLTPLSRWALRRIARMYAFTSMPPMPPQPDEAAERARAVREVLAYVRRTAQPLVALSPEGRDTPGNVLTWPAPGAGRFIHHLARLGLPIVPTGIFQQGDKVCVRFGPAYTLPAVQGARAELDRAVSRIVMTAIAQQLPADLHGEFRREEAPAL